MEVLQDIQGVGRLVLKVASLAKDCFEVMDALEVLNQVSIDPLREIKELKGLILGAPSQPNVVTHFALPLAVGRREAVRGCMFRPCLN